MLSLFVPAPGAASPSVRESLERAVEALRRTGRLPSGLPAVVANSFNARDYGTPLELSQIDRYDPATLAAEIPFNTAVLLTCSNADPGITCAMEKRIADGVTNAAAKLVRVQLDGVDHILEEDLKRACLAIARKLLKRSYHTLRELGDAALQPA
jgi:uncharacterized protein